MSGPVEAIAYRKISALYHSAVEKLSGQKPWELTSCYGTNNTQGYQFIGFEKTFKAANGIGKLWSYFGNSEEQAREKCYMIYSEAQAMWTGICIYKNNGEDDFYFVNFAHFDQFDTCRLFSQTEPFPIKKAFKK